MAASKIEAEKAGHSQFKDHENLNLQATIATKREAMEKEIERIRAEFRDFVDKINIDNSNAIAKSEQQRDEAISTINKKLEEDRTAIIELGRPRYEELTADIAKAENMIELHKTSASARAFVDKIEREAAECATKSQAYSDMLDKLEEFKRGLLKKLPFPCTEVRDGDIFVNGVPFDRINETERIKFAVNLAILKSGQLKSIYIDGLEHMTEHNFQQWEKIIDETGIQYVVTRATECPLTIEAKG